MAILYVYLVCSTIINVIIYTTGSLYFKTFIIYCIAFILSVYKFNIEKNIVAIDFITITKEITNNNTSKNL